MSSWKFSLWKDREGMFSFRNDPFSGLPKLSTDLAQLRECKGCIYCSDFRTMSGACTGCTIPPTLHGSSLHCTYAEGYVAHIQCNLIIGTQKASWEVVPLFSLLSLTSAWWREIQWSVQRKTPRRAQLSACHTDLEIRVFLTLYRTLTVTRSLHPVFFPMISSWLQDQ